MWKIRNYIKLSDLDLFKAVSNTITLEQFITSVHIEEYIPIDYVRYTKIEEIDKSATEVDEEHNLFKLIYNRNYDNFFCIIDEDLKTPYNERTKRKIALFVNKLINKIFFTAPKYIYLLEAYKNERANLLKAIQETIQEESTYNTDSDTETSSTASSTTKNNLTPLQAVDFTADGFANSVVNQNGTSGSQTTASVDNTGNKNITRTHDNNYLFEKINELNSKYTLVLNEWLDEFNRLFIINSKEE